MINTKRSILHSLRAALRRPRGRLALLALAVLVLGGGWYVTTRGGWVNALRLPPTLDAATPRAQNGWVLKNIQLPGQHQNRNGQTFSGFRYESVSSEYSLDPRVTDQADAFGLWLAPPPEDLTAGISTSSGINPASGPFLASVRLSTGETLTLPWKICGPTEYVTPGETARTFVFVALPTGYPDTCHFAEFTLSDRHGHSAHWRVSRLPRMRRAIPDPVMPVTTVTKKGVTMSASAWYWSSRPQGQMTMAQAILRPILPANSHQWDVVVLRQEREWEPFEWKLFASEASGPLYPKSGTPILARNGVFDSPNELFYGGGIGISGVLVSYPDTTHFLKLTTELRQFETYDEPVTFHNVAVGHDQYSYCLLLPKPLSVTTPSGIIVTLPAQGKLATEKTLIEPDRLHILIKAQLQITFIPTTYSLPNSPLARTYGKPVQYKLQFAPPFHLSNWSFEQDGKPADYELLLPNGPKGTLKTPPLPSVLKDLTLIVHQRVDLQAIPMTFTVPIDAHEPPVYPNDYKGPRY